MVQEAAHANAAPKRRRKIHIPLISTLIEYGIIFYRFVGIHLFILSALTLITTLVESVGITLFLPLFTAGFDAQATGESNRAAEIVQSVFGLFGITPTVGATIIFVLVLFLAKAAFRIGTDFYRIRLIADLSRRLRRRLLELFSQVSYAYYVRSNTGYLTNVLTAEVESMNSGFQAFSNVIVRFITVATLLGFAFFLYWQFTIMAVIFSVLVFVLMRVLVKQTRKFSYRLTAERSEFQSRLIQSIQAFKYIRATGRIGTFLGQMEKSIQQLANTFFHLFLRGAIVETLKEPLMVTFILLLMGYQFFVVKGSIGAIAIFLIFFLRIIQVVLQFQSSWTGFASYTGSISSVLRTMEDLQNHQENVGEKKLLFLEKAIELHNVTFAYRDEPVLRNVSLVIPKNTTVALVGRSGAGKSTLVDLIAGLFLPQSGEVRIDGVPIQQLDRVSWQEKIGYVTQDPVIFNDTIANNIALWSCDPRDSRCFDRLQKAAAAAYCLEFIQSLPEGFSTVVGDRGIKLSGGQKQRIAIARELFKQPELLILDEATSALDTESERAIQQSIDALKGKLTVIIIAHRLSTVQNADIIYVLDKGEIVESGSFAELIRRDGLFRKMVELQTLLLPEKSTTG